MVIGWMTCLDEQGLVHAFLPLYSCIHSSIQHRHLLARGPSWILRGMRIQTFSEQLRQLLRHSENVSSYICHGTRLKQPSVFWQGWQ
jgi:hypothetical protein